MKRLVAFGVVLFSFALQAKDARLFLLLGEDRPDVVSELAEPFARAYEADNPGETAEIVPCLGDCRDGARWLPNGASFAEAVRRLRQAETRGQVVGILWRGPCGEELTAVAEGLRRELKSPVAFVAGSAEGDEAGAAVRRAVEALPRGAFVRPTGTTEIGASYYRVWAAVANRLVGRYPSRQYAVLVDGRAADVLITPNKESWKAPGENVTVFSYGAYSYSAFTLADEAEVEVRSRVHDLTKAVILPEARAVKPSVREKGRLVFRMRPGQQLVVEPKGRHEFLVLAANPKRPDAPTCGSGRLRYFGPGYHRPGLVELGDGESVYLAEGAWVEGLIYARGRNITVSGPGVISGAPYSWRVGPPKFRAELGVTRTGAVVTMCGENLTIRDTTIYSGWVYHLAFNEATNAVADNVKVLGGRNINDDGIDPCRTKDLVIRNCFVHTQDDCVAPKYSVDNLLVENCVLWSDAANVVRVGFECEHGKTGLKQADITMRNIDVPHLPGLTRGVSNFWARAVVTVEAAKAQRFENLLFEDFRVRECREGWVFADIRTRDIAAGGLDYCHTDAAGYIDNLVFRNIHLKKWGRGLVVGLSAHDEAHPITRARFENVTGYGDVIVKGKVDFKTGADAP